MTDERKEIILDEIKYWKDSKLLPSEYCDFLIMLYTEGKGVEDSRKQQQKLWFILDLAFLLLLIPISFFVILFSEFTISIKILLFIAVLVIVSVHYFYFKKSGTIYVHIPIILFFLILLIGSIEIIQYVIYKDLYLTIALFIHCIVWLFLGYSRKLYYLTASGIVGLLLLMIQIFVI